jgi:hypothetical protein
VAEKIPYLLINRFGEAWREVETQIKSHQYVEGAAGFKDIAFATAAVNEAVIKACIEVDTDPEILGYPPLADRWGPQSVSEITAIKEWLETQGIKITAMALATSESDLASSSGRGASRKGEHSQVPHDKIQK